MSQVGDNTATAPRTEQMSKPTTLSELQGAPRIGTKSFKGGNSSHVSKKELDSLFSDESSNPFDASTTLKQAIQELLVIL